MVICSCFGKAFEQAAQSTNSRTQQDSFDSNCEYKQFISVSLFKRIML